MKTPTELEALLDRTGAAAQEITLSEPKKAAETCLAAVLEAEEVQDAPRSLKNQIGRVRLILASLYLRLNAFDKALESALHAHTIYQEIELISGVARSLDIVGLAHIYLGSYAKALENLLESLRHAKELEDHRLRARTLENLGLLYLRMEDYPKAREYLSLSQEVVTKFRTVEMGASLLENICTTHFHLGEFEQALSASQECIDLHQSNGDEHGEAKATNMAGEVYLEMGQTEAALNQYQRALTLCEQIKNPDCAAQAHYLIGELKLRQEELDPAQDHLTRALLMSEQTKNDKLAFEIHYLLAKLFQKSGEFQLALGHYKQFHDTKEQIFNADIATKIKSLEVIHRLKETQQDREIYRLENVELSREIEERIKTQSELERMVTLDPLTGIYNRRHFFELTQKELERSRRYHRPLSIIMLDIDHFKEVNDQYGHLAGDRVIVEVARRIEKAIRKVDLACRYGGEEFAILLPETPLTQARMVADRLWRVIGDRPAVNAPESVSVTASVGVASYDSDGAPSVDTLLDQADQAMYAAKQNGRNQVAVYEVDKK